MTVVVQPNVATPDGRLGVQTEELLLVTDDGPSACTPSRGAWSKSRMSGNTADVVVIGAGHNSLIGPRTSPPPGSRSSSSRSSRTSAATRRPRSSRLPGFRHDSCSSAHVLIQTNPVIRDDELGLSKHGLRYVHTDPAVVLPLADGDAIVMSATGPRPPPSWPLRTRRRRCLPAAARRLGGRPGQGRTRRWNAGRSGPGGLARRRRLRVAAIGSRARGDRRRFSSEQARDLLPGCPSPRSPTSAARAPASCRSRSRRAGRRSAGPRRSAARAPCPMRWCPRSSRTAAGCTSARPSSAVTVRDGRAVGVVTADGESWEARRAVLSSAHITQLAGMLDGAQPPPELRARRRHLAAGADPVRRPPGHRRRPDLRHAPGPAAPRSPGASAPPPGCTPSSTRSRGARRRGRPVGAHRLLDRRSTPTAAPDGRGGEAARRSRLATWRRVGWDERARPVRSGRSSRGRRSGCRAAARARPRVRGEAPVDLEARNRHNVGGSCHGGEFRLPSGRCSSAGRPTGCPSKGSTRPARPRTPAIGVRTGRAERGPGRAGRPGHRPGDRHGRRGLTGQDQVRAGSGRSSDDQSHRQQHGAGRQRPAAEPVEEQAGRLHAEFVLRHAHRGQRWLQPGDERHVVEADDAQVAGAGQPGLVAARRSSRARAGRCPRRSRSAARPPSSCSSAVRPAASEYASASTIAVVAQPVPVHRRPERLQPDGAGRDVPAGRPRARCRGARARPGGRRSARSRSRRRPRPSETSRCSVCRLTITIGTPRAAASCSNGSSSRAVATMKPSTCRACIAAKLEEVRAGSLSVFAVSTV